MFAIKFARNKKANLMLKRLAHERSFRAQATKWLLILCVSFTVSCQRKTPEEMMEEANQLFQQNDILSAQMKYEELIKRFPKSREAAQARMGLAMCSFRDKDYEKAREQLTSAIQAYGGVQTPEGFRGEIIRLNTFIEEKRPRDAISQALKTSDALHRAPQEAREAFQLKLAELYALNKQMDRATSICETLLAIPPSDPNRHLPVLERLGELEASGKDFAKAAATFQKYLERYPETPLRGIVLFGRGFYQEQAGQIEKARQSLAASEAQFRKDFEKATNAENKAMALLQLAKVQQFQNRYDEARRTLEQILDKNKFPLAQHRQAAEMAIATLEKNRNQPQRAIQMLEQIKRENPGSPIAGNANEMIQMLLAEQQTTATRNRAGQLTGTLRISTSSLQTTFSNRPTTESGAP